MQARLIFFGLGVEVLLHLFFGDFWRNLIPRVGIDQAVHDFVDPKFVLGDLVGQAKNVVDGGGARGDRLHHVAKAIFDAFGDLNLAFASEQLHGTHLTHVHAYGIGGTAKFRIDGGERLFGFLRRVLVGRRRIGFGQDQQLLGIRRLVVNLNAHVVDHTDDAFYLLRIQHVIRQVIVNFGIGQVVTLLTQDDKILQPGPPCFRVVSL